MGSIPGLAILLSDCGGWSCHRQVSGNVQVEVRCASVRSKCLNLVGGVGKGPSFAMGGLHVRSCGRWDRSTLVQGSNFVSLRRGPPKVVAQVFFGLALDSVQKRFGRF